MNKKQKSIIIGSFLSGTLVLTACGSHVSSNSANTSKVKNVTFWYSVPGASNDVIKNLVQKFNDSHPNIHIIATNNPQNERIQKLTAALGAGNPPDIYTAGSPDLAMLLGSRKVSSISDLTNGRINPDKFYAAPRSVSVEDSKLFAMPASVGDVALYYNQDLFKKYGISTPPKNWGEMIRDAMRLTDPSQGRYGFVIPTTPDDYTAQLWTCYLWENGGELFTADNKKVAFNSKEGVEALQLWVDLIYKYKVAPLRTLDQNSAMQTFATGQYGMIPAMPIFVQAATKFPFHVATAVLPKEKIQATSLGGWYITIPKMSKHQKEAATFLEWLNRPENGVQWNIGMGSLPVGPESTNSSIYKDYLKKTPLVQAFVDQLDVAKAPPNLPQYSQISKLLAVAINNALYKKQTPQEALDEAANKANQLLKGN
ncbi:ABC transporter substrate-binding protein [Fodinisporobacter ferrooxydans]|uniref:ABC transporter substrate-binding protein n=1 Tax=Fodinisporobacter ferrooxydans TaxID=2901836 RepID=A0ABY4CDX5_9BACL|nr:ABC transporter substrate-binding protein [Alicyclobacillaceae bacterium MYW30-H2]